MADGGATQFIMLITALIISAAASAILIDSWSSISRTMELEHLKADADHETQVELSGDAMNILYDSVNKDFTIHLQNAGISTLDKDNADLSIMVEGETLAIQSSSILSGASLWAEGEVLKIVARHTGTAYSNGDEVQLNVVVKSNGGKVIGTDTITENIRLKA